MDEGIVIDYWVSIPVLILIVGALFFRKLIPRRVIKTFGIIAVFIIAIAYHHYREDVKLNNVKQLDIKMTGVVTYTVVGNWNGYGIIGVDIITSNKKILSQPRDTDDGYIGIIKDGKGEFYLASAGHIKVGDTLELDTKNGVYNRRTSKGVDSVQWLQPHSASFYQWTDRNSKMK